MRKLEGPKFIPANPPKAIISTINHGLFIIDVFLKNSVYLKIS